MDKLMKLLETSSAVIGRLLLGLYFILPGLQKIDNYEGTTRYMQSFSVPAADALLPITIVLQIVLGIAVIIGYKTKIAAFLLAGMTLVISLYMHSFWNLPDSAVVIHETQNFIKNMAIMSGLLILAGRGAGQYSIDNKMQHAKNQL
jgi:putative oxidoreductase